MDSEGVRLKKQCTAPLKEPPSKEQTQRTAWDQASEGHCRGALSTSTLQPTKHTCRSCDERRASIQMRQTGPCTEIPLTRYCRLAVAACKLADMKLRIFETSASSTWTLDSSGYWTQPTSCCAAALARLRPLPQAAASHTKGRRKLDLKPIRGQKRLLYKALTKRPTC